MRRVCLVGLQAACLAYWLALALLLAVPRPQQVVGLDSLLHVLSQLAGGVVHLACFTVLGLLVCAANWPLRRRWLLVVAAAFAVGTELYQHGFVDGRQGEWIDVAGDLAGLTLGAGLWWLGSKFVAARWPETTRDPGPAASSNFEQG